MEAVPVTEAIPVDEEVMRAVDQENLSAAQAEPGVHVPAVNIATAERKDGEGGSPALAAAVSSKAKNAGDNGSVPYFRLFKFADRLDYLLMFSGTVGAIADGLLLPVNIILMIQLVNAFVKINTDPEYERQTALKFIKIMVSVSPAMGALAFLEPACWMRTGERQTLRIRALYLRAILRQDEGFFDTRGASTAEVVNSLSAETMSIQEAISEKVGTFVAYMTTFLAGIGIALYFSWRLGLIWVAATPLIILPGFMYAKKLGATAVAMSVASRQAGNVAGQALSSIHTVYSFVGENQVVKKYSQSLGETVSLAARVGLFKSLAVGTGGLAYAVWALVLWVGRGFVINDGLKGSSVLNAGFAAVNGINVVGHAFGLLKFFKEGCKAAYRVFEVIERTPEIDPWDEKGKSLQKLNGHLELRNIQFSYPARPNATIFSDFSLSIPAGSKMALVGGSGSGKSTVIALLERFYDPIRGQVLMDGVDIKELHLKWLRSQIGLVSQEPALFATSVRENIGFGKENATIEEVIEASKQANAHTFVDQFPDGYETQVGERGVKMSGGQKQRVAIARAILKKPHILLLDEATSALDAESEKVVQAALDTVSVGRTTVIVAHRLSTIRDADIIAVVKDGKVVEMGSHNDLSAKGGAYANLVHLQHSEGVKETKEIGSKRSSSFDLGSRPQSARMSFSYAPGVGKCPSTVGIASDVDELDETAPLKKPSAPSFSKLLAMNKPEWRQAVLGSIGAAGFGCMFPLYSFLISSVLSALYKQDPHAVTTDIRKYCFYFLGMAVAAVAFSFLQHYNFAIMGECLTRRLREKLLEKVLMFEIGWFDHDENSSGIISARLATEASVARALVSDRMSLLLQTGSAIVLAATVSIIVSWRLALVILAVQPLVVLCYMLKGQILKYMYIASIKAQEDSSQIASESVFHHRTVTAFSLEQKLVTLFETLQCSPKKVRSSERRALVAGLALGCANSLIMFTTAFSVWWSHELLRRGETTTSEVFKVIFIVIATGRMIGETGSVATDIARSATSIVKVFSILDRRTLIDADNQKGQKVEKLDGIIELKNVEFAYPTRPDVQVFKRLNLRVKAGRSVALVGRSGSGKSSVVSLIERFYDPIRGSVYIDGIDIKQLHLKTLRKHIALVSQEPTLFLGSIRENIQYGRENATEAEIIEAAKAANAYNFICGLKDGFDTNTGDRGLQLSGGQKQRIAIARAIVKNPTILLLDEATSALDTQSERVVQEALDKVKVGRTTVIVAHRLTTIQDCDSICVIQDGVVCEQGRHESLLANGGAYSALVKLQSREE